MLALYGCCKDPSGLREKWLALAWQAALAAPARERDSLIERIFSLCIAAGDVANSMKAWDLLREEAAAFAGPLAAFAMKHEILFPDLLSGLFGSRTAPGAPLLVTVSYTHLTLPTIYSV